jgi:hypothetical protein
MKLYAFAGPAGSGKTTCANLLVQEGFQRVSFARILKDMLATMGFPEPKTLAEKEQVIEAIGKSYRQLAQTLGTEWGRKMVHDNIWVALTMIRLEPGKSYVIDDLRFENEATAVRTMGGAVIHIKGRKGTMAAATTGHASEAGIRWHDDDYKLLNDEDSLDELSCRLNTLRAFIEQEAGHFAGGEQK